jgi:heterodisulfide reductase subunit D
VAGRTFSLLDDEWCCGSVALRVGDVKAARETILHDMKQVKASGAKAVFAMCAGCYRTMSKDWPAVAGEALPFEVLHVTQVLSDLLTKKHIPLAPRADQKRVAFHDPCHLGRHMKIYEPPRDVIRALPGTTIVELPRNRGNAWCCGAGGGVKSQYPDLAREIARNRIEEATSEKVDVLLSSCPFCVNNLRDAAQPGGATLQVMDIIDYVASLL